MTQVEDVTQKFVSAINRHDAEAVAAIYANDAVVQDPLYPKPLVGKTAVKKDVEDFIRALPDLRFEVTNILEKGDLGVGESRFTGTNTGPLATPMGEFPPTNKRVDMRAATYFRLDAQGLIAEERRYYDTGTLMRQLGMAPEPEKVMSA